MASHAAALLGALVALALWTTTGLLVARRLSIPGALVLPLAPAVGWAVQNVLAQTLSLATGLSAWTMLGAVALAGSTGFIPAPPTPPAASSGAGGHLPWVFYAAAAVLALLVAVAVLPKIGSDGVLLAGPVYDHAKVALVAEMVRNGVPPVNPVFAEAGGHDGVAYYYLWHFGAAQVARLSGISAWEADAGATWFTAFSSLCLLGGLAFHSSGGRSAAPMVVLLACCTGSLRPVFSVVTGDDDLHEVLRPATGFAGWFFQTTWSPHHVAAAGCVVLSTLVMAQLARRVSAFSTAVLALLLAAGFGSSIWVGGVTMAIAGILVAAMLFRAAVGIRPAFLLCGIAAVLAAAALSMPLLLEQWQAAALRGGGPPVILAPMPVLGSLVPEPLRHALDLPAYWLVLLAVQFPLLFIGTALIWRRRTDSLLGEPAAAGALAAMALASLTCGWLLVSTAGENNDLGWRAILPAILVVTVAVSAAWVRWAVVHPRSAWWALAGMAALSLPDTARIAVDNVLGHPAPSARAFAEMPALWQAVRRHAGPAQRVANNPRLIADMTPWEVNISWALLSDRRSCFAGQEMALAFAFLTNARRQEISDQFTRVFAGEATAADVNALADAYGCDVLVVTPDDGAWLRDSLASGPRYRLVEEQQGQWRIYGRR